MHRGLIFDRIFEQLKLWVKTKKDIPNGSITQFEYKCLEEVAYRIVKQEMNELTKVNTPKIELTEDEKKRFNILVKNTLPMIQEIPIVPMDIPRRGCMHSLRYGFKESKVSIDFLIDFLDILHEITPTWWESKIIYMLAEDVLRKEDKKAKEKFENELEIFKSEGYIEIDRSENQERIYSISVTPKFIKDFKKAFYFYYDPELRRQVGCPNSY